MNPIEVLMQEVQREIYIREMTDDFSSVDTVASSGGKGVDGEDPAGNSGPADSNVPIKGDSGHD